MGDERWRRLMTTSARQHQVFTSAQARTCGIPYTTLLDVAQRFGIRDLGYGLWLAAGSPNTYQSKLWAVHLTLPSDAIFTGRTALWLRQIIAATPAQIDVLVPPQLHPRARDRVRFFRGARVGDDSVTKIEKHPTASVYRAFTDAAAVSPVDSLVRWLPAMDRLRKGTLDGLEQYMLERGRFNGSVNLRAALTQLRADLPHSGVERVGRRALRAAGIPPHPRPYPVRHTGRTIAEIDYAYPKVLYGAEVDGPHHLLREVAAADKARDRQLARLGWMIERFSYEQVINDPVGFAAEVRRGLDGAKSRYTEVSCR